MISIYNAQNMGYFYNIWLGGGYKHCWYIKRRDMGNTKFWRVVTSGWKKKDFVKMRGVDNKRNYWRWSRCPQYCRHTIYPASTHLPTYLPCVTCMCLQVHGVHVEDGEWLVGIGSFISLCGSWRLNSGCYLAASIFTCWAILLAWWSWPQ